MFATQTTSPQHSPIWVTFTYINFACSLGLISAGILFLPLDVWIKGYFLMGTLMVVQSCVTLSKTLRDVHEGTRLFNKIEDAKTEQILMGIDKKR